MAAKVKNLTIEQGSTFRWPFRLKVPGTTEPINLTGFTARMQIRPKKDSVELIASLSSEAGDILIDPLEGRVVVYISDEETSSFSFTSAVYDLELVSAGGEVTRVWKGKVKLDREVTR